MKVVDKLKTFFFFFKPRKVVAMYKLYFGDEWLELSVDSVAPSMYKIVFVISDIAWGDNSSIIGDDLAPIIDHLTKKYPGKIVVCRGSWNKQLDHVRAGLTYIKNNFAEATHLLYIDSDEIYRPEQLHKLLRLMYSIRYFNRAIRIQYNTYFKTIYFRIIPRAWNPPVVLFPIRDYTEFLDARNMLTVNSEDRSDILYEHFAYVRKSDARIQQKIEAHRETEPIIGDWFSRIWINWNPEMTDFHPTIPRFWKSVERVSEKELAPEIVTTFESWKGENKKLI